MKLFNIFGRRRRAHSQECQTTGIDIPQNGNIRIQLRVANHVSLQGGYAVVEVFNPAVPARGWREISPRYYDTQSDYSKESRANGFLKAVLRYGDDVLAAKRVLFLESLQRHCTDEHLEWFFQYVVGMFWYFNTCYVKDYSRIEICICHQLADMGDEFCDMASAVSQELGLKPVTDSFHMTCLRLPKDDELASRGYDNGGEEGHRRFLHVGSDIKGLLQVHWVVNLNDIKLKAE